MRPVKNAWPGTDGAKNMKFFAQLMREMLRQDAFESFRVFSLDTLARVDELLLVIDDVSRQRLPAVALEPIINELVWSLKRDPVANDLARECCDSIIELQKSPKRDIRMLRAELVYLSKKLKENYQVALESKIVASFNEKNKMVEFRSIIAMYCTYLVNCGYSKAFLSELIEKTFFESDIKRVGIETFRALFRHLDGSKRRYIVIVSLTPEFGRYLSRLSRDSVTNANELPATVQELFCNIDDKKDADTYYRKTVEAMDHVSATKQLEQYLSSVSAITFLARRGISFEWGRRKYVSRVNAKAWHLVDCGKLRFQTMAVPNGRTIKSMESQSRQVFEQFDTKSTERLLSSINTSALARSSANLENQLISLWSAVEVLLSDPPPNTARIVHYSELLVPCICAKYVRRYIIAICDALVVGYRRRLRKILDKLPSDVGIDMYMRFTHLIFDDKYSTLREELFIECGENPLAVHRLWKLHKDFSSPKSLLDSLQAHQNRVGWQIHRIYRARNQLVHAGTVPTYLESLVLNCFEYYRSSIGSVLGRASKETARSDIDQVVAEVAIEYRNYLRMIRELKGASFDPATFSRVFK